MKTVVHLKPKNLRKMAFRMWTWESNRVDGVQQAHAAVKISGVWARLNDKDVGDLLKQQFNYMVVCRAICLDSKGWAYIESEARAIEQIKIAAFEEIYTYMRRRVIAECERDKATIVDVGWVIQRYKKASMIEDDKIAGFMCGDASDKRRERWERVNQEIMADLKRSA